MFNNSRVINFLRTETSGIYLKQQLKNHGLTLKKVLESIFCFVLDNILLEQEELNSSAVLEGNNIEDYEHNDQAVANEDTIDNANKEALIPQGKQLSQLLNLLIKKF